MRLASAIFFSMRPRQWTKNLLVFAPLVFSHELVDESMIVAASIVFAAFCLLAGSVYVLNDVLDAERDRMHAKKCERPIARGDVSKRAALLASGAIGTLAVCIAYIADPVVGILALGYVLLQIAYTLRIKHEVILDAFAISAGFVLRVAAGAAAVGAEFSPWLYSAVSLLALFLAFGKRRHELLLLDVEAFAHRPALKAYSAPLLDALLSSVTAATIVTYAMYSFSSETAQAAPALIFTVPFVAYGVFRYLFLIYSRNLGGNPEEILLTDVPIITSVILWLGTVVFALYR